MGARRASSISAWSGSTNPRAVHRPRRSPPATPPARAPPPVLSRQASQPRKAVVHLLGRALVGHLLERAALLARPLEPALLGEPLLEPLAEREQAAGVVGGVLELLRGERAAVPAREALGALQARAEHLADERLVALLAAEPEEAAGHLRVEHVPHLGAPRPAQDRHVLASGVHHDLHLGVGQRLRQRCGGLGVEAVAPADRSPRCAPRRARRVGHGHLDEAEQGPVAPLGHELRVDREPALGRGPGG